MSNINNNLEFFRIGMRKSNIIHGIKKGCNPKKVFCVGKDPIPDEVKASIISLDDTTINVECIESSGTLTFEAGQYVAYEPHKDFSKKFNFWEYTAPQTLIKTETGYRTNDEEVEFSIMSNGALPYFLAGEKSPAIYFTHNTIEIEGANKILQKGIIGKSFFVFFKREIDGIRDIAIVDADTNSAKQYYAVYNGILVPITAIIGTSRKQ